MMNAAFTMFGKTRIPLAFSPSTLAEGARSYSLVSAATLSSSNSAADATPAARGCANINIAVERMVAIPMVRMYCHIFVLLCQLPLRHVGVTISHGRWPEKEVGLWSYR